MAELLEVKNLSVSFFTPAGEVQAVRDVSFSLRAGEVLAIVGESGCGKSVLCKSILHLLPPSARRKSGTIAVNGRDITRLRERELQKLRGSLFSMVFQDPMTALNPSMTVGAQLAAAVRVHAPRLRGAALEQRVLELMRLVGIDRPEERRGLYPHHFSGGMRQRVVLAIALAGDPSILFADEPTTALDVTIQAQILDLLREIQQKLGTATVFVTHDLGAVARVADRVAVMYAGKIVELGTAAENDNGVITFRGTGGTAQSECSVRFSFLYTGDFNQAVLRAVYLDGAADVPALAIKKAASNAVTWDSADDGTVSVTAVELRSVRGLPFYAFTCSDGSVAYALACDESALNSVSGAREIYEETMRDGLREYVEISGAE